MSYSFEVQGLFYGRSSKDESKTVRFTIDMPVGTPMSFSKEAPEKIPSLAAANSLYSEYDAFTNLLNQRKNELRVADPRRGLLRAIADNEDDRCKPFTENWTKEAETAAKALPRFGLVDYAAAFEDYVHAIIALFEDRLSSGVSFDKFYDLCTSKSGTSSEDSEKIF